MAIDKKQFERQLNDCKTLKEVFALCETWYKIEDCKLGVITKPAVIFGIMKALTLLNPQTR